MHCVRLAICYMLLNCLMKGVHRNSLDRDACLQDPSIALRIGLSGAPQMSPSCAAMTLHNPAGTNCAWSTGTGDLVASDTMLTTQNKGVYRRCTALGNICVYPNPCTEELDLDI